jgi:hypothetical protein
MPKQNKISFLPDLFRGILIFLGGLLIAIETYDQ